ncbi:MAG: YkgJ family cysteine cluster protein [Kofleriaceae bacterium]
MIARGQLAPGHKRLLGKVRAEGRAPVRLSVLTDKRALPSPDVDCAALMPLCQGRCCTFTLALSAEDVVEGKLRWELLEPYVLPKAASGYCVHVGAGGGCQVYDDRPATCRVYDCREDRRVWLDYERRIPAPMPDHVTAPAR